MKYLARAVLALTLVCGASIADDDPFLLRYPPPQSGVLGIKYLDQNCKVISKLPSTVTAAERCWINVLGERCNSGDRCLASCLANGHPTDVRIGGGCWHSCSGIPPESPLEGWKEPHESKKCRAIGNVEGI